MTKEKLRRKFRENIWIKVCRLIKKKKITSVMVDVICKRNKNEAVNVKDRNKKTTWAEKNRHNHGPQSQHEIGWDFRKKWSQYSRWLKNRRGW